MTNTLSKLMIGASALGLTAMPLAAQAQEITINSFGGAYEEAHRECVITPFEEETGATVNIVTAYSADAFAQLRAQADAPQFDVIHFSGGQEIVAAQEGLLMPITEEMVPNLADVYDFAKAGIDAGEGPAYQIAAIGLIYAPGKVPAAPTAWADLMNPEYGENLVLTDISNGYGMLGFLMLNQVMGGDLDNIQPGLDAVSELLANGALVVTRSPEIQQEFAQNDAWIAPYASDYAYTLEVAGVDAAFVQGEEGTPASYITASLVSGRDNVELASRFIDIEMSADAQACFAEALRYSPTNSTTELSDEAAATTSYGADAVAGLLRFDPVKIEEMRAEWVEQWGRTIAQ